MRSFLSRSVLFAAFSSATLFAAPTLDQFTFLGGTGGLWPQTGMIFQQTITAGATGLLAGVDLDIQGGSVDRSGITGAVVFGISLGFPSHTTPPTYIVNSPTNPTGWNYFDLTGAGFFVTPGTLFTITLLPPWGSTDPRLDTGTYYKFIDFGSPNPYAGGTLYWNGVARPSEDLVFRTYVDTTITSIPEGGAGVTLFAFGLFVLAVCRRVIA
jgi:hypothetical protein